jgi:hypothetical protein
MVRSTRPDLADWTREVEVQLKELRESLDAISRRAAKYTTKEDDRQHVS